MISLLQGRQDMYNKAIALAKSNGDSAKSRRLERQLKVYYLRLYRIVWKIN